MELTINQARDTMIKTKLLLIGGGGHCHSVIESIERSNLFTIAAISDIPSKKGARILDYEINLADDEILQFSTSDLKYLITIGQIKTPAPRIKMYEFLKSHNLPLAVISDPGAIISKRSILGEGTVVLRNCFINTGVSIGVNCIINTGAMIEHDSKIGNHTHISTGAIINGDCTVGDECFIGSGAIISNGVSVCSNSLVGAGSVVFKDIKIPGTYIGNPARKVL